MIILYILLFLYDKMSSLELDGSFKLPKKFNSPMMKPKGTPKKKNGGKENSATAPEIDPMIFEGNFPILKLHRIDESLPSPLTGIIYSFLHPFLLFFCKKTQCGFRSSDLQSRFAFWQPV